MALSPEDSYPPFLLRVQIVTPAPRDRGYYTRLVFGCPRGWPEGDVEVHVEEL